jgi:hypothetical protein
MIFNENSSCSFIRSPLNLRITLNYANTFVVFSVSNVRRVLNVVCFLLGDLPAPVV